MNIVKIVQLFLWIIVVPGLILNAQGVRSAAATEGQNLFEKRCSACHRLPNPDEPPSIGWEKQLTMMAPLARLKSGQKEQVLDFLMSHSRDAAMQSSLDEDRQLFEEKCSRCHTVDRVLLSPLRGESLKHVVNRMQSRSGSDWISDSDAERVLAYLETVPQNGHEDGGLGENSSPAEIFSLRCSACHTLERIFQKSGEAGTKQAWSHTVSRMREKAPQWMTDEEAVKILEYLQTTNQVEN